VLARGLIEEELSRRGVAEADIAQAFQIEATEKAGPVCPHCGAAGEEKSAPVGHEGVLYSVLLALVWPILALFSLAPLLFGDSPKWYQCAACGHQFLYPPVYRDDLPSEPVLKRQRTRASLQTDSPQAQTKK